MLNGLGDLSKIADSKTRSISPENFDGSVGGGGRATVGTGAERAKDLGQGWKISPSVEIKSGETFTLAEIEGSGVIQHFWITKSRATSRNLILRMYWDNQEHPSVEVPLGDFFACGWEEFAQVSSLAVCTNPGLGYNCYWQMPFRKKARITLENRSENDAMAYYQITYALQDVPDECAYFHASFHRDNPVKYKEPHVILDNVVGRGHFVGCYMAWGLNNNGWWGEGEIKFYMDDDTDFPTICGTGTEDYFCGAYNYDPGTVNPRLPNQYQEYNTPYAGVPQVIRPDGVYNANQRFGMYRWHINDPIRFEKRLKVTIQCLGWRHWNNPNGKPSRYLPLQDDVASTAFWYQTLPTAPLRPLQSADELEVN